MEKHMEMNCWEFNNCPPEKCNSCLAYKSGKGKQCWLVEKTLCKGVRHGKPHEKIKSCTGCEFYKMRRGIPG